MSKTFNGMIRMNDLILQRTWVEGNLVNYLCNCFSHSARSTSELAHFCDLPRGTLWFSRSVFCPTPSGLANLNLFRYDGERWLASRTLRYIFRHMFMNWVSRLSIFMKLFEDKKLPMQEWFLFLPQAYDLV